VIRELPDPGLPGNVFHLGDRVRPAREREQQIAQAIEIDEDFGAYRCVVEGEHGTFRAAADGSGQMERRRLGGAAGEHEALEGSAGGIGLVNRELEPLDVAPTEERHLELQFSPRHARELRAEREQVFLDALEHGVDHGGQPFGTRPPPKSPVVPSSPVLV
jgi:hypothetical protein